MYKAKENILHEVVAACVIYQKIIRGFEKRSFLWFYKHLIVSVL